MNQLLAIEWLKIKRYRTFWVLVGLFAVLLPMWNYFVSEGIMKMGGGKKDSINILSTAYSFPYVWSNLGFWGSIFIPFITILVIILTTNEYAYRTNRQNVIDGWNKMQFFHAKVMVVVLLSAGCTAFLFILGLIFGAIYSGSLGNMFSGTEQVWYFFLLTLDYLGLGLFIAIWIRKSGLAIGLFLLYSMIIENILKGTINHFIDTPYGNLLPLQASDELLPFQLAQMLKAMMDSGPTISNATYAVATACWCAIYYFAGRALLLRNDW